MNFSQSPFLPSHTTKRSPLNPHYPIVANMPCPPNSAGASLPPRPAVSHSNRRYSTDRPNLGRDSDFRLQTARAVSHNHSPSLSPRPSMTRSWTIDAPSDLPASTGSYLDLPLTRSPLYRPLESYDHTSNDASGPLQHSDGNQGVPDKRGKKTFDGPSRPQRGLRGRKGGPPKAKLGGPGGKTFEEMLAAGEVTERKVSPILGAQEPSISKKSPVQEQEFKARSTDVVSQGTRSGQRRIEKDEQKGLIAEGNATPDDLPSDVPTTAFARNNNARTSSDAPRSTSGDKGDTLSLFEPEEGNPWDAPLQGTLSAFVPRSQLARTPAKPSRPHQPKEVEKGKMRNKQGQGQPESPARINTISTASRRQENLVDRKEPMPAMSRSQGKRSREERFGIQAEEFTTNPVPRSLESTETPARRTISAAGLRNSSFMRKSLGGLLSGDKSPRRMSASRRSLTSLSSVFEPPSGGCIDPADLPTTAESHISERDLPITAMTDTVLPETSSELDEETVALGTQSIDHDREYAAEKTHNAAENRTIGGGQDSKPVSHVDNNLGNVSSTPAADDAKTDMGDFRDDATIRARRSHIDRAKNEDQETVTLSKKLRANAPSFDPTDQGTGRRIGSGSSYGEEHDQSTKRAKLRPSASAFVPRPDTIRQRLPMNRAAFGSILAPNTFDFSPQNPALRSAAHPFIPCQIRPFIFGQLGVSEPRHPQLGHSHPPAMFPNRSAALPSQILLGQARATPPITARSLHPPDFTPSGLFPDRERSGRLASTMLPRLPVSSASSEISQADQFEHDRRSVSPLVPGPYDEAPSPPPHPTPRESNRVTPDRLNRALPPLPEDSEVHPSKYQMSYDSSHRPITPPFINRHVSIAETADGTLTTADGSPLLPQRLTPNPSPRHTPHALSPGSPSLLTKSPSPDIRGADVGVERPPPEIKVHSVANDKRFREWVFPSESDEHGRRPSISRRHTMPTELPDVDSLKVGVASTVTSRVDGLRHILEIGSTDEEHLIDESTAPEGVLERGISTRSSAEFPLRPETKKLTVINATTGARSLSPGPIPNVENPVPMDTAGELDSIVQALTRLELKLDAGSEQRCDEGSQYEVKEAVEQIRRVISASLEAQQDALKTFSAQLSIEAIRSLLDNRLASLSQERGTAPNVENHSTQQKETLEAILNGQQTILAQLAELPISSAPDVTSSLKDIETIKSIQEEMAGSILALHAAQSDIDSVYAQFAEAKLASSRSELENESLKMRLQEMRIELNVLRETNEHLENKAKEHESSKTKTQRELDSVSAARIAAERERDALSEALRVGMAETERRTEELDRLRRQLVIEREKAQEQREESTTLDAMSNVNVAFQEEIMARMARLDEGMHESLGSRVKEYEAVLDRNKVLQSEVDGLRIKLDVSGQHITDLKTEREKDATRHALEIAVLQQKLNKETESKQDAVQKADRLTKELEQARADRESALLTANERAAWARMSEVRIQALAQESVYWRQFALESDRKKYKTYLASQPFHMTSGHTQEGSGETAVSSSEGNMTSPPDTQLRTPKEEARSVQAVLTDHPTPTKESTHTGDTGVRMVSTGEEGTWWSTA